MLKAHCQTLLTCAIKNLKGCVPDREKRRFHALGLTRPIALLGAALAPKVAFTLVDGICGDLTFEEGGTPVAMDLLMLGFDLCAVDAAAARQLGYAPEAIGYLQMAARIGMGCLDVRAVQLAEPSYVPVDGKQRCDARPTKGIYEDRACSACLGALLRAMRRMEEAGIRLGDRVFYVGQGWRDVADFPERAVGVGRCCAACDCCAQGCPPSAEEIIHAAQALR